MCCAIIHAWQQYYTRKKAFLEVVGKILPEIGVSRRILIRNRSNGPQSPREPVAFMSFHVSLASRLFLFFLFLFWNNPTFGYSASARRSLSWLIKNAAPRSHMHSSSKQAPAERAGKNRGSCKGKPKYSALMFLLFRRFIAFVLQFSHVARTHACAWRLRVQ